MNIVAWGAGVALDQIIHYPLDGVIDRLVDSDPAKWGKTKNGLVIEDPKKVLGSLNPEDTLILICVMTQAVEVRDSILKIGPFHSVPMARLLNRDFPFFLQWKMDIQPGAHRYKADVVEATGGLLPKCRAGSNPPEFPFYAPFDRTRQLMLWLQLRCIVEDAVPGRFAEVGVYMGETARIMHHYAPDRPLHLFDTFEGFSARGAEAEQKLTGSIVSKDDFNNTSIDLARRVIEPLSDNVLFHRGYFPDTIPPELKGESFAFVHLDADLYEPTYEGLAFFLPRLSPGGRIVVHDYNSRLGARNAVDTFMKGRPEVMVPIPDTCGSVVIAAPRKPQGD